MYYRSLRPLGVTVDNKLKWDKHIDVSRIVKRKFENEYLHSISLQNCLARSITWQHKLSKIEQNPLLSIPYHNEELGEENAQATSKPKDFHLRCGPIIVLAPSSSSCVNHSWPPTSGWLCKNTSTFKCQASKTLPSVLHPGEKLEKIWFLTGFVKILESCLSSGSISLY